MPFHLPVATKVPSEAWVPRGPAVELMIGWFFPGVVRGGMFSSCRVTLGPPEGGRGGGGTFRKLAVSAVGLS